ncbi:MAG: hypothetical protein E5Y65_01845 [Mesorhizobium sp.]|uniref:hypothetical protein n=1 Tax=Mesorhizobium sp. TaxID=1871066 RepID=UPI0011F73320|nr:hypothetical protein [Mesorhizobium sp.]TIL76840.1 MAG: hypothetical protein E5Y70_00560 [Mesorhizobium sp.]TIL93777.1 MAG: hypothetical protein E5Y65_01845 [Mesorhizobium sp.]TIM02683.1 MAG: hypothetical protein E5Y64_04485 [Mesorhizobium sp.]
MNKNETRYEHGATKYPAKKDADASDQFSQEAAGNKKPASGMGLTRSRDEVEDKTHQSEGQDPPRRSTPSAATEKTSGAGPSIAERSKDAKAPKSGRQPGAYTKD